MLVRALRRLALVVIAAAVAACSAASMRARLDRDVRATFDDATKSAERLPFEFPEERQIFVAVTVNGVATTALLDSGSNITVLDRDFAERIGVAAERTISVRGLVGKATGGRASGVTVAIGSLRLEGLSPAVLDLSDVERCSDRDIPVILGEDVFERAVVEVDIAGGTIAFRDPVGFEPPAGATAVPLERVGLGRAVRVSVEGRPDIAARLDLGCGFPLVLRHAYWEREGLLERRRSSTGLAAGIDGVSEQAVATVASLRFGGIDFPNVPAVFRPIGEATNFYYGTSAVLGLPVLGRFHLWIDYPHDALYVLSDAARRRAPFERDRLGLAYERDAGFLRVVHVAAGSPSATAGFRVGDRVATIDRRPAANWTPLARRAFGHRPPGSIATFRMADGTSRTVTLADYY